MVSQKNDVILLRSLPEIYGRIVEMLKGVR